MEAKTKSGTFLTESCGRASDTPPPQRPPQPKSTTSFDAAPNVHKDTDVAKVIGANIANL